MWCDVDLRSAADNPNYKHHAKAETWWNVSSSLHDTKGKNSIWTGYREGFIAWLRRDREGKGEEEYIPGTSLSLCGCVNAFCCCLVVQRPGRSVSAASLSVEASDEIVQTVSQMPTHSLIHKHSNAHTHIHSTNTEKLVHGHAEGHPHIVFTHLFLLLPLTRTLLHHCFCFKVWAKGLLSQFIRGLFMSITAFISSTGLEPSPNLGLSNDDHRHNNHL